MISATCWFTVCWTSGAGTDEKNSGVNQTLKFSINKDKEHRPYHIPFGCFDKYHYHIISYHIISLQDKKHILGKYFQTVLSMGYHRSLDTSLLSMCRSGTIATGNFCNKGSLTTPSSPKHDENDQTKHSSSRFMTAPSACTVTPINRS